MPIQIHARERKGVILYRLWSTERDCYCGVAMTEEDARLQLTYNVIHSALFGAWNISDQLKNAAKHGITSRFEETELTSPWEKQLKHPDFPRKANYRLTPEQKQRALTMKVALQRIIDNLP